MGNHEFDDGVEGLLPFLENVEFPILIANLNMTLDHPLWKTRALHRSIVLNVKGLNVGIIGYLTPATKKSEPARQIDFSSEILSIK